MAGHGSGDAKQAILSGKNGCILKPIQVIENLILNSVFFNNDNLSLTEIYVVGYNCT